MTNLDTCLAYLSKLPPAVSGSGGHNVTLRAACECVRFGLTDAEALQALGEFNRRCSPPWSEGELAHKLESARRIASNEAGTRAPHGQRPKTARAFDQAALERRLSEDRARPVASTQTPGKTEGIPTVAINPPTVAEAMAAGYQAAGRHTQYRQGAPIVGQAAEVEELYWSTVWRALGRPDPTLAQ